jgi:hypothetical protein
LWPGTWDEFGGSCATVQRSVDEIVADLLLKLDKDHLYSKDKGRNTMRGDPGLARNSSLSRSW